MNESQRKRFSEALERVADDGEMLTMLATIATEDAPGLMAKLECHISDTACAEAARTAHSLKGLLSTFETGEPVSELQGLIDAARQEDAVDVNHSYAAIKPKLAELLAEIEELTHRE